ncbi:hypothetical protein UFOVP813_41 [uncultured Caudovirales phage]|uniref:Uncharacterized protein n=1 Tax=uncultured Caudovirales phage TaxID=2100421 RepID=A0A6J5NVF1_9CAUD|nr:hypothetical protein UFOVP813_41 [uncultured Caudovirales phage]
MSDTPRTDAQAFDLDVIGDARVRKDVRGDGDYVPSDFARTLERELVEAKERGAPLFIPLKTEFFEAFESGAKTVEYRKRGPRWNTETCRVGRRVLLSCGYGKARRLTGTITGFHYHASPAKLPGWVECYGSSAGYAACITIKVDAPLRP